MLHISYGAQVQSSVATHNFMSNKVPINNDITCIENMVNMAANSNDAMQVRT